MTEEVALLAGIISAIRVYRIHQFAGFGWAKLASATIDGLNIQTAALIVMGVIASGLYTSIGGVKSGNLYRYYSMVNSYRWIRYLWEYQLPIMQLADTMRLKQH
jgi:hypothetical protein